MESWERLRPSINLDGMPISLSFGLKAYDLELRKTFHVDKVFIEDDTVEEYRLRLDEGVWLPRIPSDVVILRDTLRTDGGGNCIFEGDVLGICDKPHMVVFEQDGKWMLRSFTDGSVMPLDSMDEHSCMVLGDIFTWDMHHGDESTEDHAS